MAPAVLVTTDFSPLADAAVAAAHEQARLRGARLHILHVASAGEYDAAALLAQTARQLDAAVPVETAVRAGDAADEIVRYAADLGADLIVVGTHGRTGPSRLLLGSVAERVLRMAPCAVLAVPARRRPPAAAVEAAPAAASHRCIVCAEPTPDLVCEGCRARIRGDALRRKQQEERAGRAGA